MQLLYLFSQSSRLQSVTETSPPGPDGLRVTHFLNRCLMSVFNLLGYYNPRYRSPRAATPEKPDTTVSAERRHEGAAEVTRTNLISSHMRSPADPRSSWREKENRLVLQLRIYNGDPSISRDLLTPLLLPLIYDSVGPQNLRCSRRLGEGEQQEPCQAFLHKLANVDYGINRSPNHRSLDPPRTVPPASSSKDDLCPSPVSGSL